MPLIEDTLHEGDLDQTLQRLQEQVRKAPADSKLRVFLFQLLALMGQWDRAMTQLNVAGELDAGTLAMVQTYREALRCEVLRGEIFVGRRSPLVFGEPEEWFALLIEAQRLGGQGAGGEAREMRLRALDAAPTTPGTVDGTPFEWIMDGDTRLGPVLEAIVNGRYYWIPFHRMRAIQVEKPEDLRDLVWMPAHFVWANGGDSVGLIPTRYPGSETSVDAEIRLGRRTEWVDQGGETFAGLGQRMLFTDNGDYSLMDIRTIALAPGPDEDTAGHAGGAGGEAGDALG